MNLSQISGHGTITIDIATWSCSRTVTTVFAGELVELKERLLVLKKKERREDAVAVWEIF